MMTQTLFAGHRLSLGSSTLPALRTLALAALLLPLLGGAAQAGTRTVDERRDAAPAGTVEIEGVSGSFTITGWEKAEVQIQGKLDERIELDFTREGDHTIIEFRFPKRSGLNWGGDECDLTIRVPEGSDLTTRVVSADLTAALVKGEVDLETVSGQVEVRDAPRRVRAKSVSGSVRILAETMNVVAESVSGSVLLRGSGGQAELASVSGDVEVQAGSFTDLEVSSVSGNVRFAGRFSDHARGELSSHSGTVEVIVPVDTSADFSVETFSGSIQSDFGGEVERTSQYVPGKELEFSLGSGSGRIEVSSFSGSVRLIKK